MATPHKVAPVVLTEPLDLDAAVARIYARDTPYPRIVLAEVPLLLAEIRRCRALLAIVGAR